MLAVATAPAAPPMLAVATAPAAPPMLAVATRADGSAASGGARHRYRTVTADQAGESVTRLPWVRRP